MKRGAICLLGVIFVCLLICTVLNSILGSQVTGISHCPDDFIEDVEGEKVIEKYAVCPGLLAYEEADNLFYVWVKQKAGDLPERAGVFTIAPDGTDGRLLLNHFFETQCLSRPGQVVTAKLDNHVQEEWGCGE